MKKTLLALSLFALAGGSAFAQFNITQADMPQVNDAQYYTVGDTTGFSLGSAGTGVTWNYATLAPNGSNLTVTYKAPSSTPQAASFPNANLAYTTSTGEYRFFDSQSAALSLVGDKSQLNTAVPYPTPALWVQYPLAFGGTHTGTVNGVYPDGFLSNVTREGTVVTTYDAAGTLITPVATYNNVARLKFIAHFEDSSWAGIANGVQDYELYEWYQQGTRMPVMRYYNSVIIINGGNPTKARQIWYADVANSTDEPIAGSVLRFEAYPSPAQTNTGVEISLNAVSQVKVELVNVLGEQVAVIADRELSAGTHHIGFDATHLARGVYFVNLHTGNEVVTRKLVLE